MTRNEASFDLRDIRRSMDVFTIDNAWLGVVLFVTSAEGTSNASDGHVPVDAQQSSAVSGELLGPMPTQTIGNSGPRRQSARAGYATAADATPPIARGGTITVGKWWGLAVRRTIPLDAIQTVSLERVVLKWTKENLS